MFTVSKIFCRDIKNFFKGKVKKLKKIFIIFILMLAFLPIQAGVYQNYVITLRSQVSKITLSEASISEDGTLGLYKLYGGLDSPSSASIDYIKANDISQNDIVVYFRVAQLAKTRTNETIKLSIEAESLENIEASTIKLQDPSLLTKTSEPVISDVSCFGMKNLMISYSNNSSNSIQFQLIYNMGIVENVNLAFFTSTWKKTEGLVPGLYISKITLSYITN